MGEGGGWAKVKQGFPSKLKLEKKQTHAVSPNNNNKKTQQTLKISTFTEKKVLNLPNFPPPPITSLMDPTIVDDIDIDKCNNARVKLFTFNIQKWDIDQNRTNTKQTKLSL